MNITATAKYIRISPSKVRLVANSIKKLKAEKALGVLKFLPQGSCKPMYKLLKSAITNAKNTFGITIDNLYIKEIRVDKATTLKRIQPRAQGRADQILKRASHIKLTLTEKA